MFKKKVNYKKEIWQFVVNEAPSAVKLRSNLEKPQRGWDQAKEGRAACGESEKQYQGKFIFIYAHFEEKAVLHNTAGCLRNMGGFVVLEAVEISRSSAVRVWYAEMV